MLTGHCGSRGCKQLAAGKKGIVALPQEQHSLEQDRGQRRNFTYVYVYVILASLMQAAVSSREHQTQRRRQALESSINNQEARHTRRFLRHKRESALHAGKTNKATA